jgi:hypothetical protein
MLSQGNRCWALVLCARQTKLKDHLRRLELARQILHMLLV